MVATQFSVAYKQERELAAEEIIKAADATDHVGFEKYLRLQADVLKDDSDPEKVYDTEKAWINLEGCPIEFTVVWESYLDKFSKSVAADSAVQQEAERFSAQLQSKDTIGARVGLVNLESQKTLSLYMEHLQLFRSKMPFYDEYGGQDEKEITNIRCVDVDLIAISGDLAAARGGMIRANALPNDDKLSVQRGEGKRMTFHRQMRLGSDTKQRQEFLDSLIDSKQHDWYDLAVEFSFTIAHELGHALGPKKTRDGHDKKVSLGKYGDIIEENKADTISIVMTDDLVQAGKLEQEKANKIYLAWVTMLLPNKQPMESEAHRFRELMQFNYLLEKGAINLKVGRKISINPDKIVFAAKEMLSEIISLQLEGDASKAEQFVKKNGQWNDILQYVVDQKSDLKSKRYRLIEQPVAHQILGHNIV